MSDGTVIGTTIKSDKHLDLQSVESEFIPHPGEYHLIEVDALGNEIKGTDTSITVKMYEKVYKNLNNFKVKKNPF